MFSKILIANRGEIAVRIIRTARRLGIRTAAVYSEADARALHVALADEAHLLGPAPARESYLNGARIVEIARRCGAQAVHPGYGFLAENADFAQACLDAGLVFIGPPPAAIRAMGSKSAAKELMESSVVPLVPGYHGRDQSLESLQRAADHIGYPVLIKAALGGGGRGMRVVGAPGDLADAVAAAQREASAAFGSGQVLLEKYFERPRHIEIQVFCDQQGNALYLFERDCSVQRRYQKVLEEAPAPGMTPQRRERMGRMAVAAAKAIDYVGAGTVEFLVSRDGSFYFMEMNTRLQVEHPVTEMITGLDLVEWQIRIAAGQPLPLAQEELAINGHAIEARIYAEDPYRDFLPSGGRIAHLRLPRESAHVRVDAGVREGDTVGLHYDPMIAKLIVWDADRAAAVRRLRAALGEFQVAGVTTNIPFLSALAAHPAYESGEPDTGLIARHRAELLPEPSAAPDRIIACAALSELLRMDRDAALAAQHCADRHSPWHRRDGWRLNQDNHHVLRFKEGERDVAVTAHYRKGYYLLDLPGGTLEARGEAEAGGEFSVDLEGVRTRVTVVRSGAEITLLAHGECHRLTLYDPLLQAMERDAPPGSLTAPMPGTVAAVMVKAGDRAGKGAPLLILEAMKMEHTLTAPVDGTVTAVLCSKGEQVREGAELVRFEAGEDR